MKKRILIEIGILLLLGLAGAAIAHETRNFKVLGKDKQEFVLQPHVAPLFSVKQISGPAIPETGSLNCIFKNEERKTPSGDTIIALVGYCEGGIIVEITGIDLNH